MMTALTDLQSVSCFNDVPDGNHLEGSKRNLVLPTERYRLACHTYNLSIWNAIMFGEKSLFHPRWKNTPDVYLSLETHCRGSQVPSLVWFCLCYISEFPDQLQLPNKLIYRPSSSLLPKSFRLIDSFLRAPSSSATTNGHSSLDLKTWPTLVGRRCSDLWPDTPPNYEPIPLHWTMNPCLWSKGWETQMAFPWSQF